MNRIHIQKAKVLFIIGLVLLLACQRPAGPPPGPYAGAELRLEQLSVTCTEAWLKVSLAGVDSADQGRLDIELKRNDTIVASFAFLPPDTIIRDFGLQPGRSYRYRVYRGSGTGGPSPEMTVTTLDTTSHDFVWEIDTLGKHTSYLNDVWIVNENDIWVVGNIETVSGEYNAARWDGNEWRFFGIYSNTADLYSILYFSEDDIWVTSHCFPIHWDGHEWTLYHLQNMGLDACAGNAIWGSSPDDVYFVGDGGSIVHWDGAGFEKIESGTTLFINDIWGTYNSRTEQYEILAVASGRAMPIGQEVLKITGDQVTTVTDSGLAWRLSSIYFIPEEKYYIVGAGVFECNNINTLVKWKTYPPGVVTSYFSRKIRGNGVNDIFIVGDFGEILHYNGVSWMNYTSQTGMEDGYYLSLAFKDNLVVSVGQVYDKGVIAIGRR